MASNMEEKVRQYAEKQIEKEIGTVLKRKVREGLEEQLESKVASIIQDVLGELEDRGIDTQRSNVNYEKIAGQCVLEAMTNPETSTH